MQPEQKLHYHEFRCASCEKLLFKGILVDSEIEVKCKRCGHMNEFHGEPASKYYCPIAPYCENNPIK